MKEIILIVEIIFLDFARKSFKFPISNNIRTSFWLLDSDISTFSELQLVDEEFDIWMKQLASLRIVERDFLKEKLNVGGEFKLGVFPKEIAFGRIIDIKFLPPV